MPSIFRGEAGVEEEAASPTVFRVLPCSMVQARALMVVQVPHREAHAVFCD